MILKKSIFFIFVSKTALELKDYLYTILSLILITSINVFLNSYIGYRSVGYLYLMTVIGVGFRSTFGPILLSAFSGVFIWNFFFIPPKFTFHIAAPEDRMMCLAFIFVGLLSGYLARNTKRREKLLILRENSTRSLYNLLSAFSKATSTEEICILAKNSIESLFNSKICIILSINEERLNHKFIGRNFVEEKDYALAQLSLKNKKAVGWTTAIFSEAKCLCIPIIATHKKIGVILFYPQNIEKKLTFEEESLLNNICLQLSNTVEHFILQNENQEIHLFKESEKLHQTLLNSVSHEMRIPLTTIQGNIDALQNEKVQSDPSKIKLIHQDLIESCQRLNQVIENLLDMNRLNSGFLNLKMEYIDAHELVKTVIELTKNKDHKIFINNLAQNLIVFCDVKLIEHALLNLLLNAINYSPFNSEINIEIDKVENYFILRVKDQGQGIPEDKFDLIFNKFYRLPGSPTGGVGLGLSIVKGIIDAHRGVIKISNRLDQTGAIFEIQIPWKQAEIDLYEDLY